MRIDHQVLTNESTQLLTAFASSQRSPVPEPSSTLQSGNPCLLRALPKPPTNIPAHPTVATQCQSWLLDKPSAPTTVVVRCYSDGRLIQCCGHGLLATAFFWQRHLKCNALSLQMNDSAIASWREGELIWLSFTTLTTQRCPLPDWLEQIFPEQKPPVVAAIAGDEHSYLVLQWPDGFALSQLSPVLTELARHTQRALICTAADPDQGDGAIELRYFAPQYGVPEDQATGSAMRVLSHFWSDRFKQLSAWQCSTAGAQLWANFKGQRVEIGGRCQEHIND